MSALKVSEIFLSLQGETVKVGLPTAFVRLAGCPARCVWCDTEYAFKGGQVLELNEILAKVQSYQTKNVTVTGGEPLAQENCFLLLTKLCDAGFSVNMETGGMLDITQVDKRVSITLDIKPPDSGEHKKNYWDNLSVIKNKDQVKFVLASKADYEWAKDVLQKYNLAGDNILFSPVQDSLKPQQLAGWILEDKLDVRFQLQLHKILWGDMQGT